MGRAEAVYEDYLVKQAKKYGIFCRKLQWVNHNGAPDRFLAYKGKVALAEMKSRVGKPSAIQRHEIRLLKRQGVPVYIPRSNEEVDEIIKYLRDS